MRRKVSKTLLAGLCFAFGLVDAARAQETRYALLLKGGHVIDPANHLDRIMDVAVSGGKIAAVEISRPVTPARLWTRAAST